MTRQEEKHAVTMAMMELVGVSSECILALVCTLIEGVANDIERPVDEVLTMVCDAVRDAQKEGDSDV